MPLDNLPQLQRQLQMVDDHSLMRALSTQQGVVPPFMLMMEVDRRQKMRLAMPSGPVAPQNMLTEMARGMYQPVPNPTPALLPPEAYVPPQAKPSVDQGMGQGIGSIPQNATPAPSPQNLNMNQPAAMGSIFSGQR